VTPVVAELRVVDDPDAWRAAGFTVAPDGTVALGRTTVRFVPGPRPGIAGWTLAGVPGGPPEGGTVDGLPTEVVGLPDDDHDGDDEGDEGAGGPPAAPPAHANAVTHIDHIVALTPDLDRTTTALAGVGLDARRTREAGTGRDGVPRRQRFFRLGETILELVGPVEPTGTGPARFWGLAHEVSDLDTTVAVLGDRLSRPRDAVQPGRRIVSLQPASGVGVPTAFLSADARRSSHRGFPPADR
jgi:hypothetical protein